MSDPRVAKLAQVLVRYSIDVQPGEQLGLQLPYAARELALAAHKEAILAGAHVHIDSQVPGAEEIFYKYASDEQLDHVSPFPLFLVKNLDAYLIVMAPSNTREMSGIDPARRARRRRAMMAINQVVRERRARHELKGCITLFPTEALAQEADMSLSDYQDFVYSAGLLDQPDPVALWKAEGERQRKLIAWMSGRDQVVLKGSNIDLRLSIKGRSFLEASGRENFPDGEIYISPVESSANGWVRFGYPAIYGGQEVVDIELWFEDGKIVKEQARKGQELLTALLDSDESSRYLGELGIGTNYGIQRFTKNMLFDEKIGGTIHLAVGSGFPESGGQNVSAIHWDMLCDMAESEITVDGELFYQNGKTVI